MAQASQTKHTDHSSTKSKHLCEFLSTAHPRGSAEPSGWLCLLLPAELLLLTTAPELSLPCPDWCSSGEKKSGDKPTPQNRNANKASLPPAPRELCLERLPAVGTGAELVALPVAHTVPHTRHGIKRSTGTKPPVSSS